VIAADGARPLILGARATRIAQRSTKEPQGRLVCISFYNKD